jgi:hypothetical protein
MRKSTRITTKKQSRRRRYKTKCRRSNRLCVVRRRTRKQYGASGKRTIGEAVEAARKRLKEKDSDWYDANVMPAEERSAKRRAVFEAQNRPEAFRAPSVIDTSKTAQNAIDMGYDSDELAKRGMKRKSLKGYAEMIDEHNLRLDHALENQKASLLQNEMRKNLRKLKTKARRREEAEEVRRREEAEEAADPYDEHLLLGLQEFM